ncbi:MAG: T9SS type A sorting domain-containing protein [Bacteroidota bacterium]
MYWNGSAWVSTGHTTPNGANNLAQGPGCMYTFNATTGQVYRYTGSGNATLVTTLAGWDHGAGPGGAYDIVADVNCNFYVINTENPSGGANYQALIGYSPTGVQLSSCTLTNMPSTIGGVGFAITGSTVVVANINGLYDGTAAAGNVTFTTANAGNQGWLNDMATCPISANGPCIIPLPMELIDFSANLNTQKTVDLTWETISERDNDYFTVDKSTDGVNWSFLKTVDGSGTTTELKNYNVTDEHPSFGINYYRLRQTDFDGEKTEGIIKTVEVKTDGLFMLSPNPGKDLIFLNGKDLNEYKVEVFNNLGESLHVKLDVVNDLQLEMNTSNLAAGVYYVSLRNSHSNQILKLTIQ